MDPRGDVGPVVGNKALHCTTFSFKCKIKMEIPRQLYARRELGKRIKKILRTYLFLTKMRKRKDSTGARTRMWVELRGNLYLLGPQKREFIPKLRRGGIYTHLGWIRVNLYPFRVD